MSLALSDHSHSPVIAVLRRLFGPSRASRSPHLGSMATPAAELTIDHGTCHSIHRPQGKVVRCLEGGLWITHDGDQRDVVLLAGQEYVSKGHGRMLLYGLSDALAIVTAA